MKPGVRVTASEFMFAFNLHKNVSGTSFVELMIIKNSCLGIKRMVILLQVLSGSPTVSITKVEPSREADF